MASLTSPQSLAIGIAGPVTLELLQPLLPDSIRLPHAYSFPLLATLVLELHRRGHCLSVFAGSSEVSATRVFEAERLRVYVTPRRSRRMAYDGYAMERRHLAAAMRGSDCDVIHAHWTYEFAAAVQVAGRPCLITAHDAPWVIWGFYARSKASLFWLCRILLAHRVLSRARHITAVSPYVARHLQRYFVHKGRPVQVIPNGIAMDTFARGAQRQYGNVARPVLASIMEGWQRRKNPQRALAAFAALRLHFPLARYRLYGSDFGPGEKAEQWAQAQGLAEGVEFRGRTPYLQLMDELLREVDLYFHPAVEEAHPMSVCEAMALGLPVLGGARSGGVPFTLNNGQAGRLVDVHSVAAMAQGLADLLANPESCRALGQAGHAFALQHFTIQRMVDDYLKAYHAVWTDR